MVLLMLFIEFPIIGPLRFILLIMEWTVTIISSELAITFIMRYKKQPIHIRTSQELGFTSLFIGLSLMQFFLIIADYFSSDTLISPFIIWNQGSMRGLFLNFGYFSLLTGALIFIFFIEKYKKYLIRKYFLTACLSTSIIIFFVFSFFDLKIIQILFFYFWFPFFLFFVIYFIDFFKKVMNRGNISINLLKIISQFLFLTIGLIFSTEYFIKMVGLEYRSMGSILQIISLGWMFYFFVKLPPFSEFDWQDKIEEILVLSDSGIGIYHKSFIDKTADHSEVLISGAITGVNIMLEEITATKDTRTAVIEKKGKLVNIFKGDFITGVLISKEKLNSINFHLKEFIEKVERIYHSILINWDGNIDVFSPLEDIINEIFAKK